MTTTVYDATLIVGGAAKAESEEQLIEAWQVLIDSGTVWEFEPEFVAAARTLIRDGCCTAPTVH